MTTSDAAPRAVVLLSGGLDSATTAAIARDAGFAIHALSVDYGQRHRFELGAARRVALSLGVAQHRTLTIDLATLGGSALTDQIDVPQHRTDDEIAGGIPITYVPARNTVMLSLALAFAETIGARDVFVGVNAVDYSGYPDCRPEYIAAFEAMANLATRAAVEAAAARGGAEVDEPYLRIRAPLIQWTKAQIITRGLQLGVDYGLTHTCYCPSPAGISCGSCDACLLRLKGFADAGVADPIAYA
jgi:7-cyano-7-deazaguanine synthase